MADDSKKPDAVGRPPRTQRGRWSARRVILILLLLLAGVLAAGALVPATRWVHGAGYVITDAEVELRPSVEGAIERRLVSSGAKVAKDQLLVQMKVAVQQAAYDRAVSSLDVKRAELNRLTVTHTWEDDVRATEIERGRQRLKLAQAQLTRISSASTSGAVSPAELEQAELEVALAVSELAELEIPREKVRFEQVQVLTEEIEAAQKLVDLRKAEIDLRQVRSPMSGTVYFNRFEPGEVVKPERVLGQVYDRSAWVVKLKVSEASLRHIKKGQPAEVDLAAYPTLQYGYLDAVVCRVLPVVTPRATGDGIFYVEARLEEQDRVALQPGMSARVQVNTGRTTWLGRLLGW